MAQKEFDISQELKVFRTQLFSIDRFDECLSYKLNVLLGAYQGRYFNAFAEEFLIAGFNTDILNPILRSEVDSILTNNVLPSIRNQDETYWDRDRLMFCLVLDNEDVFAQGLQLFASKKPLELPNLNIELNEMDRRLDEDIESLEIWRDATLLNIAVIRDQNSSIKKLGSLNEDFNTSAIRAVYEFGRWECLRKLLEKRKKMAWRPVKLTDFMTFLMRAQTFDKAASESQDKHVDFGKCVDLLLKYADYEVNEQNIDQYTALHLAVRYNKHKSIFHLLKRGAYIGVRDAMGRPAISHINPKALEKHFDHCITGENLVVFNYENLIAPSGLYPNDMTAIEFISKSNDLRYLLEHPLIASFLSLKWTRLALIFYTDFVFYFLLSLMTGLISMYYIKDPANYLIPMGVCSLIFVLYIGFRRLIQVIFCSSRYRRSWENYLNSLLTISNIASLGLFIAGVFFDFHKSTLAAICIVLVTYEFFLLAGTFWHFSIYYEMFIAVAKSSIQSLQLYAIFLPAFSLLFYILLCDAAKTYPPDANVPDLNRFSTIGSSMVKTIAMSAGEFDVINVNFGVNAISVYVFVGFVFLISTVFMNLLNGLAVSDTQKIQLDAELRSLRRRTKVLTRYEEVLSNKSHWVRQRHRLLWRLCRYFIHLNTFVYENKRIYIELDDEYKVYSVKVRRSNSVLMKVPLRSWTRMRTAPIDMKFIQEALQIRERNVFRKFREREESNEIEHGQLSSRMARMEKSLKMIEATLKALTEQVKGKGDENQPVVTMRSLSNSDSVDM